MTMALANLKAGLAGETLPHLVPESLAAASIAGPVPVSAGVGDQPATRRLKLVVGNKAYSSWSLRAWLACKIACTNEGFEETVVPLAGAGSDAQRDVLLQYSPTGKVPVMTDSSAPGLVVWDSLAICEYVAELHPKAGLWPSDARARALARAAACEMHSGFQRMRAELPMNCRRAPVECPVGAHEALGKDGVARDVERICELWETCLKCPWRISGHFLFGSFGIVDAMFAPVVLRFDTYKPKLTVAAQEYCSHVLSMPEIREWVDAAKKESWHIDNYESL